MEIGAQQAREALQEIAQAETLAARNSRNNGVVPMVWGVVLLVALIIFDIAPRLVDDPDLGLLISGGCLSILPIGAGAWTSLYRRRLPIQPRVVDRPRLYLWWSLYHVAVVCGGMALGFGLARSLHRHCLPFGAFTAIGLVDAAPLLYVGWTQRLRARGLRP